HGALPRTHSAVAARLVGPPPFAFGTPPRAGKVSDGIGCHPHGWNRRSSSVVSRPADHHQKRETMQNTPSPSRIVLMASGAVLFIFSFLAFVKGEEYDMNTGDVVDKSFNAWSGDAGTLFLATWPALFGLLIAG